MDIQNIDFSTVSVGGGLALVGYFIVKGISAAIKAFGGFWKTLGDIVKEKAREGCDEALKAHRNECINYRVRNQNAEK